MATITFADLVQYASENGWGQLAEAPQILTETEGKAWQIPIWVDPGDGNTIDLTGVSVTAEVLTSIDGDVLVTLTAGAWQATGSGINYCVLTAAATDTDGSAGTGRQERPCPFHVTLTSGSDVVDFCGVQTSLVVINQGD